MHAFRQQTDYLGWINGTKWEATRQKRLLRMLNELSAQDLYMRMAWRPERWR
jgi:hypothetical protein